jgi:HK97 family phage prohead protease
MEVKQVRVPFTLKADGPEGSVQAVFSTFGSIDRDGDIVLASAFTHGQAVPMVWSHDWSRPVGKGQILVSDGSATFDGAFFLDTDAGRDAYATVKAMADLQEWSWGFRVIDAAFEQREDQYIRVIKRAEVFEVSPVLKGAGIGTHTLAIKGAQPYADQADAVLAAASDLIVRSKSLADLRAKEGRTLSTANRTRLATLKESLASVIADLEELLAATEPPKALDVTALHLEYQHILARLNGAA